MRQYTPLVTRLAHNFIRQLPPCVQVDDLVQSGMIGLLEATRNHDASLGATLETYAVIRIRGAMVDSLRERGVRRLSRHVRGSARAVAALEQEYMRPPRDAEIAARLGIDLPAYHAATAEQHRAVSLDEIVHEFLPSTAPGPEELAAEAECERALQAAVRELSAREQILWRTYFGAGQTLHEAGAAVGLSGSGAWRALQAIVPMVRRRMVD